MIFQVGDKVEAIVDFGEVRKAWPELEYPNEGDVLTVSSVAPHPAAPDSQMLTFLEGEFGVSVQIPGIDGISSMGLLGPNFRLLSKSDQRSNE